MPIFAQDWYWTVGPAVTDTPVYSSKRNIYVDPSDADYQAWLLGHGAPASIPNEADLWYYIKDIHPWWMFDGVNCSQPAAGQYRKNQLTQYNSDKRSRVVAGGMTAAGIPIKTDDVSRGYIVDARSHAEADPTYTTQWYGSDGNFYPVDAATIISMSDALTRRTSQCYVVFKANADAVTAGSITTTDQIDAAFEGL